MNKEQETLFDARGVSRLQYRFDHATSYMCLSLKVEDMPRKSGKKEIVFRGSNAMLLELGIQFPDPLITEWNLGLFLAMTAPKRWCHSVNAMVTTLESATMKQIHAEMALLHEVNQPYYWHADCAGAAYNLLLCNSFDCTKDEFNRVSGVTRERMQKILCDGYTVVPDKSDSLIANLLGDTRLREAIGVFNDKNHFARFLDEHYIQIPFTNGVIIPEIPEYYINLLLACNDSDIFHTFFEMVKNKSFPCRGMINEHCEYFIKVSASAGGNSIEPSLTQLKPKEENIKIFRGILANLKRRNTAFSPFVGLQLLMPVPTKPVMWKNPIDPRNTEIFSPCLTLRIDADGRTRIGQVADQMLKDGNTWVGSYWDIDLEKSFIERVGVQNIATLALEIASDGYYGYFGTDFILSSDGEYFLVKDPNGRMNGNDHMFFTKLPLLMRNSYSVQTAFLSVFKIGESTSEDLRALYSLKLKEYRYKAATATGIVMFPAFRRKNFPEPVSERFVKIVYLNPKLDSERFIKFYEELVCAS